MNFKEVCRKIKNIEIQGAESIAVAGVKALKLKGANVKELLNLRPTEPMLRNSLKSAKKIGADETLEMIKKAREEYINYGVKLVKNNSIVFTHCHSSSVIGILIKAKKLGKRFEVINTETRPLFQGRKTAEELAKAGIKVTIVVDAAAGVALSRLTKKKEIMMIGMDAVLTNDENNDVKGVVNKIGSGLLAEIAYDHKIPVYVVGNSWKTSFRKIKLELRNYKEIWKRVPKHIKIENPAFEIVDKKYITGIVSELGILNPKDFIRKVKKMYRWIL